VRSHGIRLEEKLDLLNATRCISGVNTGSGEVARIAGIEDRQDFG
jgi:hypothetical protein